MSDIFLITAWDFLCNIYDIHNWEHLHRIISKVRIYPCCKQIWGNVYVPDSWTRYCSIETGTGTFANCRKCQYFYVIFSLFAFAQYLCFRIHIFPDLNRPYYFQPVNWSSIIFKHYQKLS